MWLDYLVVVILLLLSGLFSGLTLGLMGLDPFELERKVKLGNRQAKKIFPLRKKGNLLLSTLLIGNVAVNSTLAVFLGSITVGVIAGFIATCLIVVFGEIIPQAVISRHALKFGAKTTWLVYLFLYVFYPVTKPISLILDHFLGGELPNIYSRHEFKLLLQEHKKSKKSDLTSHEFAILEKGLLFRDRKVKDIMTPRTNTFFVRKDSILTKKLLEKIHQKGHSRIPVFNKSRTKIVGILYSKDLISVDADDGKSVQQLMRKKVFLIKENDRLDQVLNRFKKKRVHLFIVKDKLNDLAGIVTLEDVIEEIFGEIMDEYDWIVDMRKAHLEKE